MMGAIREVFGEEVLGIDPFHVMQELNNGIRRDLLDFRNCRFRSESKELFALRDWVCSIQEMVDEKVAFPLALASAGPLPAPVSSHGSSCLCAQVTGALIEILKLETPDSFFSALVKVLDRKEDNPNEIVRAFVESVQATIPETQRTGKGMSRVKQAILKKLKAMYLGFRTLLDEESTAFYKDHWVIFFQPKHMTAARQERLDAFLARYPELNVYRSMTLQVGEIYRLPPDQIDGHQIHDLEENKAFSDRLNTAIGTLKKNAASILRFVDLFKKHPMLPRRCRANTEWYNMKFKRPFKAGNNLVKRERLLARPQTQLHGTVEWHVPEATVT
jgi:hypothetical protein